MIIGYIGLGLLLFAYILLVTKRFAKYFIPVDMVASITLLIHAMILNDIPFIIVNGFVSIMLGIKLFKKEEIK